MQCGLFPSPRAPYLKPSYNHSLNTVVYTYWFNQVLIHEVITMSRKSGSYHKRLMGSARMKQLKRIREQYGYKCFKCGIALLKGEVDHIIPLEQGGSNDDNNMQLLCISCHERKTAIDRGYSLTTGTNVDGTPTNPNHHWN